MGWTVTYDSRRKDVIAELTAGWENEKVSNRCLAHCFRGGAFSGTLYAVFEKTHKDGSVPPLRWIFVALMRYYRGKDGGWGYKDMDETCGPCEVSCPLKYLDMASPPSNEWAREWREKVRAYWKRRQEGRDFAKTLKPGDVFESYRTGKQYVLRHAYKGKIAGEEVPPCGAVYLIRREDARPAKPVAEPVATA